MTINEWIDTSLGKDIWIKKYRYDSETFDEWLDRVSNNNKDLRQLILEKKFLFGGRVLANRNIENSGSYFNCYSSGFIEDDYKTIMDANTKLGLTYKHQGGQGISLSKLRPKGTPIGKRYTSDGIVPFMEIFNSTTAQTSQGGARKGALLISLDIKHKEAETFIKIKSEQGKIEKANLSLEIDDEFMKAVEKYYISGEEITLHEKREYSGHIIEYDIIPIKLFKLLVQNCYDWAEPACIFTNKFRNYNLMEYDDDYQIETCNPCGEQPLPKHFCCNLGSLNLSTFVDNPYTKKAKFNYEDFKKSIKIAVKELDKIIDENQNNHALEEQKNNSLNYRNIGLGIMGYANCLMQLGIIYGSEKAKEITNNIFDILFKTAVCASNKLAEELGTFPKYKPIVFDSTIIKNHFTEDEINELKRFGLRNCSLISIAPTGSISNMLGVSGGCEPEFAIKYKRKTESLNSGKEKYYDVYCNSLIEYQRINNTNEVPNHFIASADIDWRDRVEIQSIMQLHVDTAISSTVNLKRNTTIEEVEQLYLNAWKYGLKGITIFRVGSKKEGILTTENSNTSEVKLHRGDIIQVNDDVIGKKRKLMTGCGSLHCSAWFDPISGELLETFLSKGSTGGCLNSLTGLSRMISLAARSGCDIYTIVDQLNSCGTCAAYAVRTSTKKDTSKGACCPIAVGNALLDMYNETRDELGLDENEDIIADLNKASCPECGEEIISESGCVVCKNCGWSRCE